MIKNVTKVTQVFLVLLLAITVGFLAGCKDDDSDSGSGRSLSGFIMDIVSGQKITDGSFTVSLDTAYKTYKGKYDAKTGRYAVSGLPNKQFSYTITVTDENAGYNTFSSTNTYYPYDDVGTGIKVDLDMMKNIPVTPATLQVQEMVIRVVDVNTGSLVGDGSYKLLRNTATIDTMEQTTETGNSAAESLFLAQDATPIQGTFTGGGITIAAGTLLYGYNYTLQIWSTSGYLFYDSSTAGITINPYSYNSTTGITVALTPVSSYSMPKVIGISNYNGSNFIASTGRSLTITFDQNIEIDKTGLQGVGVNSLLSRSTSDSDGDGTTTATVDAETVTAPAYSTLISYAVSSNQLTITLAADDALITGGIDTDDDLYYTLSGFNLLNNLLVKSTTGDPSYGWSSLSNYLVTFKGSNTVLFVVR